jgi:hypothetical protein
VNSKRERGDEQEVKRQCFCWAVRKKRRRRNPSMGSTRGRSRNATEAMEVPTLPEERRGITS